MADTPVIEAADVIAGYVPEVNILNGCNLRVEPGEFVGIIGPNGAGKSTLLKAIAGTLAPRSGERITAQALRIGYFAQHQVDTQAVPGQVDHFLLAQQADGLAVDLQDVVVQQQTHSEHSEREAGDLAARQRRETGTDDLEEHVRQRVDGAVVADRRGRRQQIRQSLAGHGGKRRQLRPEASGLVGGDAGVGQAFGGGGEAEDEDQHQATGVGVGETCRQVTEAEGPREVHRQADAEKRDRGRR